MQRASRLLERRPLVATLVFLVVVAFGARTTGFAFLNYDDDIYVTENAAVQQGLAASSGGWAFTTGHGANWHPLTWLSHMLDVELYGLEAGGHHLTNVLLHALNAALLYLFLAAATRRPGVSLWVALAFALHPLRAESVAWVSERKDVLAGTFWMLALCAWGRWTRRPSPGAYLAVVAALALGLMAKPMLVTLPFVLLLLGVWPLVRERAGLPLGGRAWLEQAPLLALVVVSSVATLLVQRAGGAVDGLGDVPSGARLANGLVAYATYVGDLLVPHDLAPFYPHPATLPGGAPTLTAPHVLLAAALLATLSGVACWARRRAPAVLVGWLWFLGTTLPVSGLVQVGLQSHADRYTYLPSVGLLLALGFGLRAFLDQRPRWRPCVVTGAGLLLVAWAALGWRQLGYWRDSGTLFQHAVNVSEDNFVAHNNLGEFLEARGDREGALREFREVVRIRPDFVPARTNLAQSLVATGRLAEAVVELTVALRSAPEDPAALAQLGSAYSALGRDAEAVEELRRSLAFQPAALPVANTLAWVLATSSDAAVRDPVEALMLARACAQATQFRQVAFLETLAAAHAASGNFNQAVSWQERALDGVPTEYRAPLEERLGLYRRGIAFRKRP